AVASGGGAPRALMKAGCKGSRGRKSRSGGKGGGGGQKNETRGARKGEGSHSPTKRRGLFWSLMGGTKGGAAGPMCASRDAAPAAAAPVDQNPIRRRGVGLRALDATRAWSGLTLFAPMGRKAVHLIDLHGSEVHTWNLPYPPGLYGYLTDRGTLFYNGQIPNDTFLGKTPFMGGAAMEVDWNGRILGEVR